MSAERQVADGTVVRFDAHPKSPRTMRDTGLEEGFLIDLLVKVIYRIGLERASEISQVTKLSVVIIDEILRLGQELKLIETLGQRGASMTAEMRSALSGLGRARALEAMAKSEYAGPAPVPLANFVAQADAQSIRGEVLSRAMLEKVFSKLTLSDELMAKIGPAVNSGQSIMLYGPAGNGKSSIAIAVTQAYEDNVYLPYCFEVDNQVITLYDPTVHHRLDNAPYAANGLLPARRLDDRPQLLPRAGLPARRPRVRGVLQRPERDHADRGLLRRRRGLIRERRPFSGLLFLFVAQRREG